MNYIFIILVGVYTNTRAEVDKGNEIYGKEDRAKAIESV